MRHVRFAVDECSDDNYLLPSGSVGRLRTSTDDGSCRGTLDTRIVRPPLQAETLRPEQPALGKGISGISLLTQVARSGISAVQRPEEWIMIDVRVDSSACATVMPAGICPGINIHENDLSRNGVEYEVANGESISNLGECRCEVMTIGSMIPKRITFQIADVHKPRLSITACSDMG